MDTRAAVLSLIIAAGVPAVGQEPKSEKTTATAKPDDKPDPSAKFVRLHKLKIASEELAYTSTAEDIVLKDAEGKSTATFFTISYIKDGVANLDARPITFVFNG